MKNENLSLGRLNNLFKDSHPTPYDQRLINLNYLKRGPFFLYKTVHYAINLHNLLSLYVIKTVSLCMIQPYVNCPVWGCIELSHVKVLKRNFYKNVIFSNNGSSIVSLDPFRAQNYESNITNSWSHQLTTIVGNLLQTCTFLRFNFNKDYWNWFGLYAMSFYFRKGLRSVSILRLSKSWVTLFSVHKIFIKLILIHFDFN